MQDIVATFGIDLRLIIIQMVNFVVLMGILGYFLYNPILNILKEREAKIAKGIKDANDAAVAKASAESEKQQVLSGAHEAAAGVVERARSHAAEVEDTMLKEAQTKAASLIGSAEARATEAARRIEKESEAEIAKLAVLATEKLLRERA